jgi:hypothetical protein
MTSPKSCSPIPGFRSWLRAFVLTLSLIPVGFVLYLTRYPSHAFVLTLLPQESDKSVVIEAKTFLAIGWLAFVGIFVPIIVLGHIHQFLWGEPDPKLPWWMPSNKSQIEGFCDWFVAVTSIVLCAYVYAVDHGLSSQGTQQDAQYLTVGFVVLAAYLYHIGLHLQTFFKKTYAAIRHWLDTV